MSATAVQRVSTTQEQNIGQRIMQTYLVDILSRQLTLTLNQESDLNNECIATDDKTIPLLLRDIINPRTLNSTNWFMHRKFDIRYDGQCNNEEIEEYLSADELTLIASEMLNLAVNELVAYILSAQKTRMFLIRLLDTVDYHNCYSCNYLKGTWWFIKYERLNENGLPIFDHLSWRVPLTTQFVSSLCYHSDFMGINFAELLIRL
jgi:hypothetical protein